MVFTEVSMNSRSKANPMPSNKPAPAPTARLMVTFGL